MKRSYYFIIPVLGTVFCLWYVFAACSDVIYSDYVRLVNSYLPDVWNPDKFFVPDVLTRVPVNYLERMINVELFGYSTMFDRVLGVIGLGLSGFALGLYCKRKEVGAVWFCLLMAVLFSLNKWEMLVNGSGWVHFMACAGFYYHYLVIDRVRSGQEKKGDSWRLVILPFFLTIFVAGPYCAIYSVAVILTYGFFMVTDFWNRKKTDLRYGGYALCSLVPLLLYMWSNSYAVEDHAASAKVGLLTQLADTPGFFVRFFVKSFSSMVVGGERAQEIFTVIQTNAPFFILGALVMTAYLLALFLNFRYRLYEKTVMPLILVVSGGLNHVLILLSRWIFLNEDYGASSRYALQFQIGIIGIIVTFALVWKEWRKGRQMAVKGAVVGFSLLFLAGNCYTTYYEMKKAPIRKYYTELRALTALDFENKTDDELRAAFEYRMSRPESGALVRQALTILKENGWNVFRD